MGWNSLVEELTAFIQRRIVPPEGARGHATSVVGSLDSNM